MEKFNLKWKDFQPNVSASFKKLRNHSEFHDVTLVSNDQKQVLAHKVVLSACSAFFNNILAKNKHPHPMLCLDGISSGQLDEILDYIYFGEVQILHENINTFLDIAERLEMDGLIGSKEEDVKSTYSKFPDEKISLGSIKEEMVPEESKSDADIPISNMSFHQESKSDNEVPVTNMSTNVRHVNDKIKVNAGNFSSVDELDNYIKEQIINTNEGKQCGICFYRTKFSPNLKGHIETHLEGLSFSCGNCDKSFSSRESLRKHMKRCERK